MLGDGQAEQAINCDLNSGALRSFSGPKELHTIGVGYRRAYRLPNADGSDEVWIGLPSEFSSVVRSPLANDTGRRIYWTNPGDTSPWWNTYDRIAHGLLPYNLGMVQPDSLTGPSAAVVGGSATPVSRSYVYTYVDAYGAESAPSAPSAIISGPPDGTWTVTGLPATAPPSTAGYLYPDIVKLNLYRTITGQQTGGQFFLVHTFEYPGSPPPGSYVDATDDTTVVNNLTLGSTNWGNPPVGLDGLTALPGGMLVGFTGNTIHFCEPNRPHSWPASYDQSLQYDIVGMGVWQQSLVVLTKGAPSVGNGNTPANYIFNQVRVSEPCLSRGSIVTDLSGVYYASQNGLVRLDYSGINSQTTALISEDQWVGEYKAADIIACRHRSQYLAINSTGIGFAIDFADKRIGVVKLNPFNAALSVWNDEYSGDTYLLANGVVYRWDDPAGGVLVYRWRSKQLYGAEPVNLGAVQILLDKSVADTLDDVSTPVLFNNDPTLVLPSGVNAVFRVYAGQGDDATRLVHSRTLTRRLEIFRLPSGFKEFEWQCELVSRVPVFGIKLAPTMKELKSA
jgi:hypothetical protein